ncbi:ABC transporter family protein, partial [Vibrio parahaemolyticus V-223/04]
SNTRVLM